MSGGVIQIFICPVKGQPMREVIEVFASREFGLAGDRYGAGSGSWSTPGTTHRQVSLMELEAIIAGSIGLANPFLPVETRRNIITMGIDLNALVGKEFSFGAARLRGTKLCDPCDRPAILVGRKRDERKLFAKVFENRGGLCAEVIGDGLIRIGDPIVLGTSDVP